MNKSDVWLKNLPIEFAKEFEQKWNEVKKDLAGYDLSKIEIIERNHKGNEKKVAIRQQDYVSALQQYESVSCSGYVEIFNKGWNDVAGFFRKHPEIDCILVTNGGNRNVCI